MGTRRTIRMRRLANRLHALREATGRERPHVARDVHIDQSTLWSIETAHTRPQRRTLDALLDYYQVTTAERVALIELWQDAANRSGMLETYDGYLPPQYRAYVALEADAETARDYEGAFIPGLLQTRAYAEAVIRGALPQATDTEAKGLVDARMRRQNLIRSGQLRLWTVLDEAVIARRIGEDGLMAEQLAALVDAARLPNVTIQLIPFTKGAHPGMAGCFQILDFPDPDDPPVVYLDSAGGDLLLERPADVRRYRGIFELLQARALDPADSITVMESASRKPERSLR